MQALLVEEAPATPVRLLLVALGAGLAATQIGLLVWLEGALAAVALAALSALAAAVALLAGQRRLRSVAHGPPI